MTHTVAAFASLLFTLAAFAPATATAQSPRRAGEALRQRLREAGLDKRLAGEVALSATLDASRAVGTLRLRTDLVKRGETPVYRIQDRLTLSFPGLGSASLFLRADLRADLSPIETVLESEEPRGRGTVATTRIELRREKTSWVRYVSVGNATPTRTVLTDTPADVLVLTPPFGAGERLLRLLEPKLGLRLSLRALDLETGQAASWKVSIDDRATLRWKPGAKGPREGFLVRRSEAAADLEVVLSGRGQVARLLRRGKRSRLAFQHRALVGVRLDPASPVGVVRQLLGAIARGDAARIAACLDLSALHAAAGKPGEAADFRRVLLARLADAEWLRTRGLDLPAEGAAAHDFATEAKGKQVEVKAVGSQVSGFVLSKHKATWRVVKLPAAQRK